MAIQEIWTIEDFNNIRLDLSGDYALKTDLDFTEEEPFIPFSDGGGWNPFTGSLNGEGHVVKGIRIEQETEDYIGIFGLLDGGAYIHDISFDNLHVEGSYYVGGIAGYAEDFHLEKVRVWGVIQGTYGVSGFIGTSFVGGTDSCDFTDCTFCGTLQTPETEIGVYAGAFLGEHYGPATILRCSADIKTQGFSSFLGGLVGCGISYDDYSPGPGEEGAGPKPVSISQSWAVVEFDIPPNGAGFAWCQLTGGLVGQLQDGLVQDSYARGILIASGTETDNNTGVNLSGFIGDSYHVTCQRTYSSMEIDPKVWRVDKETYNGQSVFHIETHYWWSATSEWRTRDNLISSSYFDSEVLDLILAEDYEGASPMGSESLTYPYSGPIAYGGWDFSELWVDDESGERNGGYPTFAWEGGCEGGEEEPEPEPEPDPKPWANVSISRDQVSWGPDGKPTLDLELTLGSFDHIPGVTVWIEVSYQPIVWTYTERAGRGTDLKWEHLIYRTDAVYLEEAPYSIEALVTEDLLPIPEWIDGAWDVSRTRRKVYYRAVAEMDLGEDEFEYAYGETLFIWLHPWASTFKSWVMNDILSEEEFDFTKFVEEGGYLAIEDQISLAWGPEEIGTPGDYSRLWVAYAEEDQTIWLARTDETFSFWEKRFQIASAPTGATYPSLGFDGQGHYEIAVEFTPAGSQQAEVWLVEWPYISATTNKITDGNFPILVMLNNFDRALFYQNHLDKTEILYRLSSEDWEEVHTLPVEGTTGNLRALAYRMWSWRYSIHPQVHYSIYEGLLFLGETGEELPRYIQNEPHIVQDPLLFPEEIHVVGSLETVEWEYRVFQITFHVYNALDSSPLEGATVTSWESSGVTNSQGNVTLSILVGFEPINFTVSHPNYVDTTDSFHTDEDTTVSLGLIPLQEFTFELEVSGSLEGIFWNEVVTGEVPGEEHNELDMNIDISLTDITMLHESLPTEELKLSGSLQSILWIEV